MHAQRTNRFMLLLLAFLLIAAGAATGAASLGAFGSRTEHRALLHNGFSEFYGKHGDWMWPLTAFLALLIALAALLWLRTLLFSTDRAGDLPIAAGGGTGRTTLAPSALTQAVSQEIEGYRGVGSARARLIGDSTSPKLVVTATLHDSADVSAVRRQIQRGALAHARTALAQPELPIQLDLGVTSKGAARVI